MRVGRIGIVAVLLSWAGVGVAADPTKILIGPSLPGPTASSVMVAWWTDGVTSDHEVQYGPDASLGKSTPFTFDPESALGQMLGERTDSPVITINGLSPGVWHYRIRSGSVLGPPATFALPDPKNPVRVAVWGNNRDGHEIFAKKTVPRIEADKPDLLMIVGNMVGYGFKESYWKRDFFEPAGDLLRRIPFLGVRGAVDGDFLIARRMLVMPGNGRWYVASVGTARVIALDTNADLGTASEQISFIKAQSETPEWRFASHRVILMSFAPYHTMQDTKTHSGLPGAERSLMPALERARTDLIIGASAGLYERGQRPRFDDGRMYFLVTGGAGAPLAKVKVADWPFLYVSYVKHHFVSMEISADEMKLKAIDIEDGSTFDEFSIPARPLKQQ